MNVVRLLKVPRQSQHDDQCGTYLYVARTINGASLERGRKNVTDIQSFVRNGNFCADECASSTNICALKESANGHTIVLSDSYFSRIMDTMTANNIGSSNYASRVPG